MNCFRSVPQCDCYNWFLNYAIYLIVRKPLCFINREIVGRSYFVRDSWLFQSRGWFGERNLPRNDISSVTGMFVQFFARFAWGAISKDLVNGENTLHCKKAHLVICCPSFSCVYFCLVTISNVFCYFILGGSKALIFTVRNTTTAGHSFRSCSKCLC